MKSWSKSWKSSKKPRKQRKYRLNAPLHIRKRFLAAHLSSELRKKRNRRSMAVVVGDKVKILRGQFKGTAAKVEEVDTKASKLYIAGIEMSKKDGSKTRYPVEPSNVIITELNLDDKKRNQILARKKPPKE
jgi:large subunit ribosomal protein L24